MANPGAISWADKTPDQIVTDIQALLDAVTTPDDGPQLIVMPARLHRMMMFRMARDTLSRRAFRRWRGRWKAERKAARRAD